LTFGLKLWWRQFWCLHHWHQDERAEYMYYPDHRKWQCCECGKVDMAKWYAPPISGLGLRGGYQPCPHSRPIKMHPPQGGSGVR
jgi:hypothetical protein